MGDVVGKIAAVPHTVRGAEGLVDGDARDAKPWPRREGQGGDVDATSASLTGVASGTLLGARGWKSSAENLSEMLGRFFLAEVNWEYSSFSALMRAFSSRVSLSTFFFFLFSI